MEKTSLLALKSMKSPNSSKNGRDRINGTGTGKGKNVLSHCADTSPCLPRPEPSAKRDFHYFHSVHPDGDLTIRVLSYNCLAPIYCTETMHPHVDPYMLAWDYRKYNLVREILRYKPDVVCLQEVQQNHFDEFFTKELSGRGFEGMYRPKSSSNKNNKGKVDGCAIFFRRYVVDLAVVPCFMCQVHLVFFV